MASRGMTTFRKMQWASRQHARFGGTCQWQTRSWNEASARGSVFLRRETFRLRDVRDEILRSWKRCHEAGLDPLAPAVPLKQNRDESRRR